MFLPLYDENAPTVRPPYVTFFLIGLNVFVFFVCAMTFRLDEINSQFGLSPARFLNGENFSLVTLFTHMFLHANFWHLALNMWALWLFGDNVEHHLGHARFLFFYLFAGIVSGLFFVMLDSPWRYVVGASGAISGVMGAYLILFPKNKIRALWLFLPVVSNIPAFLYIGIYFVINIVSLGSEEPIAYIAHIGGYIGGILLLILIKRKKLENKNYESAERINI